MSLRLTITTGPDDTPSAEELLGIITVTTEPSTLPGTALYHVKRYAPNGEGLQAVGYLGKQREAAAWIQTLSLAVHALLQTPPHPSQEDIP